MSSRKVVKPASGVTGVFRERLEKTAKGNKVAAAGSAVGKREKKTWLPQVAAAVAGSEMISEEEGARRQDVKTCKKDPRVGKTASGSHELQIPRDFCMGGGG